MHVQVRDLRVGRNLEELFCHSLCNLGRILNVSPKLPYVREDLLCKIVDVFGLHFLICSCSVLPPINQAA